MAIITPQGAITLYTCVPLIEGGEDTLDFEDEQAQRNYFDLFKSQALTDYSYIKGGAENGGTIRVNLRAEDCYNCNYLSYQNSGFTSKRFYAFVREVRYISPEVCEIAFAVDDWQTWLFSGWFLGDCQIERETVTQSQEYDNSVLQIPEQLPAYTATDGPLYNLLPDELSQYGIRVVTSSTSATLYWSQTTGYPLDRGGTSEVSVDWFDLDAGGAKEAYEFIAAKTPEQVLSVTIAPRALSGGVMGVRSLSPSADVDLFIAGGLDSNYRAKNNKCYSIVELVTRCGSAENIYREVDFAASQVRFAYFGDALGVNCGITVEPIGWLSPTQMGNYGDKLLPQVGRRSGAWSISYNTEIATRSDSYANGQTLKTMLSPLFGLAGSIGNLGKWAVSSAAEVGKSVVMSADQRYTVNSTGATPATDARYSLDQPVYCWRSCSATDARKIDIYYSAYGYRVDRFGKPNLHNRANWDYIKLSNVMIYNSAAPADAMARISDRLREGLRIWHNTDLIGSITDEDGNPRGNACII